MKRHKLSILLAAMLSLTACAPIQPSVDVVTSDSLNVQQVANLPDDFIMGMDASCVPALEKSGVKYYRLSMYLYWIL